MSFFILDRRFITGAIDDDVPSCVLIDIANGNGWINPEKYGHGILMDNIMKGEENLYELKDVESKDIMQIDKEMLRPHAAKIASFVNCDKTISWSLSALHVAFLNILWVTSIERMAKKGLGVLCENISIGPLTPERPLSFNACMLYRLCKHFGIKTRPTMLISDMSRGINLARDISLGKLIVPKNALPKPFKSSNYVNFLLDMDNRPARVEDYDPIIRGSFDVLCKFYDNLSTNTKMLSRISPSSHEEAVIIAALIHNVDISSSRVPSLELEHLAEAKTYLPIDRQFKDRFKRNPSYFSLKRTYCAPLAMVYDNKALEVFVRSETVPEEDYISLPEQSRERRDTLKNILFQTRISNTFYHGWHPDAVNSTTLIELEDLSDRNADIISTVSYGSAECGGIIVYRTSELSDHFNSAKIFSNPTKITENFPSIAIRKLKLICRTISVARRPGNTPIFTEEQKGNFRLLLEAISNVEATMITLSTKAEDFKIAYEEITSESGKQMVKKSLKNLLEMGMCMRGWKVSCPESTFPLHAISTVTPVGRQSEVDDSVNYMIHEFKDSLSALNKVNKSMSLKIKALPLVCVQKSAEGKAEFKQSTTTNAGFTIWDRIGIVCQGDVSNNTSACIRISSNWIVSSAYYYMLAIGMPRTFNIEELANIS